MDNKTLDFLDELRRKSGQSSTPFEEQDFSPELEANAGQTVAGAALSAPKTALQGAGALLTKTISGLAAVGNFFPALIHQLEMNTDIYDKLYGKQDDGSYVNPGKVTGANVMASMGELGEAFSNAAASSKRVASSENLNELAVNAVSGAEILKNLPGGLGEAFNSDDKTTNTATAILGFGMELLLDPTSKLSALAKGATTAATKGAVASGKLSAKAADLIGGTASDIVTGNWVAGPVAMGIRESSELYRKRLADTIQSNPNRAKADSAKQIAEYLYGPLSMARDEMRPLANQLISLRQELPKFMLKASGLSAMAVAGLPAKAATEARELFSVVSTTPRTAPESDQALNRLLELGVKKDHIDAVVPIFQDANRKLISFLDEGRGIIQGMDDIKLDPMHLREAYYINADRRSRTHWLQAQERRNTPGGWQIHNMGIKAQLEERLGIASAVAASADSAVIANNSRSFDLRTAENTRIGMATDKAGDLRTPTTNVVTGADVAAARKSADPVAWGEKTTYNFPAATYSKMVDHRKKTFDNLTIAIEKLDNEIAKKVPAGSEDIGISSGLIKPEVMKLIERRNKLISNQDALENRMNNVNVMEGEMGVPPKMINMLTGRNELPAPGNEAISTAVNDTMKSAVRRPAVIGQADIFTPDQRKDYMDKLIQYANKDTVDTKPTVFRFNPDGSPTVQFAEKKAAARKQTMDDLLTFTDDYLDNLPIAPDKSVRTELHQALEQAIAYVPGSKEFVKGLKAEKDVLRDIGKMRQYLVDSGIYTADNVNSAVVSEPYVDEIFKPLLGQIKEFSARSAIQSDLVSDLAADVHIYTEMQKRGLVKTPEDIAKLPEAERGQWEKIDGIYSEKVGTDLWAHKMDLFTIKAIDRSLDGETHKIPAAAQWASQLFKRNALLYNPASHATQWLGNAAMLSMSGYKEMFSNPAKFSKLMRQAHTSILSGDDLYEEAVRSGVTVSASVLDDASTQNILRNHLTRPKSEDMGVTMHNIIGSIHTGLSTASMNVTRGVTAIGEAAGKSTKQSYEEATHNLSPGALYSTSDQLLRVYVFQHEMEKGLKALSTSYPSLKGWTKKDKPIIDMDSLDKYHASSTGQTAPVFDPETLGTIKAAYQELRENAANVANDVGLNMADTPRLTTYLSRSGVVPFINFQTKAVGRTLRWMDETPWTMTPFFTAQRNANQAFNDDPGDLEADVAALPQNVRNGLIIPTDEINTQGYPIYMDLARWSPFGPFLGAGQDGFGTEKVQQPNALVSVPFADLASSLLTGEGRAPGQSFSAFAAATLARTFGVSGIGPGSNQIDSLAKSIEATTFSVDRDGNVHHREPSNIEKEIIAYNNIPKEIGEVLDLGDTGTATGAREPNITGRSRTTPDVAAVRLGVPGYGYAVDPEMSVVETVKRADIAVRKLQDQINSYGNKSITTAEDGNRITDLQNRIARIELQKTQQLMKLQLGE